MAKKKHQISTAFLVVLLVSALVAGAAGGVFASLTFISAYAPIQTDNGGGFFTKEETVRVVNEESEVIDVVNRAQESVVSIVVSREVSVFNSTGDYFDDFFFPGEVPDRDDTVRQEIGGGTGFVVTDDGLILTNRHVVSDTEAQYTVVLSDGTEHEATIIDRDVLNDIAFIKIEAENLTPLELGDSDQIQIGQTVIAIGNTLSQYSNTVTKGVISGIDRRVTAGSVLGDTTTLESAIQTDAAINPGNSGGPLLDIAGRVIGINTAVNRAGEGIGFAIPINAAKQLIDDVVREGRIIRPFLGVRYVIINERVARLRELPVTHGALIVGSENTNDPAVMPGTPAEEAGLQEGDVIMQVNGTDVTIDNGLAELLSEHNPGETVTLSVRRGGETISVDVTLADRDDFN